MKLILLIVGIFVAGALSGYFVYPELAQMRPKPKRPTPEQWGPARMKKISERLGLTREQEEKLQPIVHRDMAELGTIRANCLAETKRVFERMEHDIAELLTPEQRVKFEQMNREIRDQMQRFIKERPFGLREGPPKNSPPPDKPPGES